MNAESGQPETMATASVRGQLKGIRGGRAIALLVWFWLAFVVGAFALFSLGGGFVVLVLAFTPLACAQVAVGIRLMRGPLGTWSAVSSFVLGLISSGVGVWALATSVANSSEDVVKFWSIIFLASSLAVAAYSGRVRWELRPT